MGGPAVKLSGRLYNKELNGSLYIPTMIAVDVRQVTVLDNTIIVSLNRQPFSLWELDSDDCVDVIATSIVVFGNIVYLEATKSDFGEQTMEGVDDMFLEVTFVQV